MSEEMPCNLEIQLGQYECIVTITERGSGWVIAQSDFLKERDVLLEESTEDNGFCLGWDEGLSVGVYLLTIEPWGHQDYSGEWDCGINVKSIQPMWTAKEHAR